MAENDVIAMKPGRDLDLEVALKVMNFLWITHWLRFSAEMAVKWIGTQQDLDEAGGVLIPVKSADFQELKQRENFDEKVPPYSTSSEHAKLVIEAMEKQGFSFSSQQTTIAGQPAYSVIFKKANTEAASVVDAVQETATAKAAILAISK